MTIEEAVNIRNVLSDNFDSHDFIREFIYRYPSSYGELLIKHNSVTTAHAEIANYLKHNSTKLNIIKIGETNSSAIFGQITECALWSKIS